MPPSLFLRFRRIPSSIPGFASTVRSRKVPVELSCLLLAIGDQCVIRFEWLPSLSLCFSSGVLQEVPCFTTFRSQIKFVARPPLVGFALLGEQFDVGGYRLAGCSSLCCL